jgi:hypothetical protein
MIRYLDEQPPATNEVEFERDVLDDPPPSIELPGGSYVRSLRCADDGAVRYVWQEALARPT